LTFLEDILKLQCNSVKIRGKNMFRIPALKEGVKRLVFFFARCMEVLSGRFFFTGHCARRLGVTNNV
jgi:hypothetical protein